MQQVNITVNLGNVDNAALLRLGDWVALQFAEESYQEEKTEDD